MGLRNLLRGKEKQGGKGVLEHLQRAPAQVWVWLLGGTGAVFFPQNNSFLVLAFPLS